MKIALSIDFDFFVFEDPKWDFGHRESPLFMESMMWCVRVISMMMATGINLVDETSLSRADFHPSNLFHVLKDVGFNFDKIAQFTISDSHTLAYTAFQRLPYGTRIINLDAHHDLGYLEAKLMRQKHKKGYVYCDDWLYNLLRQRPDLELNQVYPNWKGMMELEGHNRHWERSRIKKQVKFNKYSKEFMSGISGEVTSIHICKSSAWVPAWHDNEFTNMVQCVESELDTKAMSIQHGVNCLSPREFDVEGILNEARQARSLNQHHLLYQKF
jgi:hypothetical protein